MAIEEVEKHSDETRDDIVAKARLKLLPISMCILEGLLEGNENKFDKANEHCNSAVRRALKSGYAYHSGKFFQYKDDYSYFTQKTLYEENHKNLNRVQNLLEEFERSLEELNYHQGFTDENVAEAVKLHASFADRLQDLTRDLREAYDQKEREDQEAYDQKEREEKNARRKELEDKKRFWRQIWLSVGSVILGSVVTILLKILFDSSK